MPVPKRRNITFDTDRHRLDVAEIRTPTGPRTVEIPAQARTVGWAAVLYMLENNNRRVYEDELVRGVIEIMDDAAPDRLRLLRDRETVKTPSKGRVVEQPADTFEERVVTNAKNFTRVGGGAAYGMRLVHRGVVLRHETEPSGRGYFYMYTEVTSAALARRPRGRKKGSPPNRPAAARTAPTPVAEAVPA